MTTKQASKVKVTEIFKGRVNCIKLIRQLGTTNDYFTESVGKERAIKLMEELSAAADNCLRIGNIKNVDLKDSKKDVHMLDFEARKKVAENYTDSEEAQMLCSVSLMNKQDTIFASLKHHINETRIFGKKKKKSVKAIPVVKAERAPSNNMANVVYNRKNYLEVIDADLQLAMKVIKEDLDQVGGQRIEMPDATYIRLNEGSEAEPKYTVYKISNEVYISAYVAATRTSPKLETQNV